ncbi:hypothetical protein AB4K20DRAFT_1986235 [Rhizopus microsporus]
MPQSLRLPMSFYLHYLRRRCRRAKEFSFYLCPLYIKRNFQNKITLIQDIRERFSNDYRSVEFLYDLSCLSIRSSKSWPSLRCTLRALRNSREGDVTSTACNVRHQNVLIRDITLTIPGTDFFLVSKTQSVPGLNDLGKRKLVHILKQEAKVTVKVMVTRSHTLLAKTYSRRKRSQLISQLSERYKKYEIVSILKYSTASQCYGCCGAHCNSLTALVVSF